MWAVQVNPGSGYPLVHTHLGRPERGWPVGMLELRAWDSVSCRVSILLATLSLIVRVCVRVTLRCLYEASV